MRFITAIATLASVAMAGTVAVDADVKAHVGNLLDVDVDIKANIDLGNKIYVAADVDVALDLAKGYKCPAAMTYSPWMRSCSCEPGLSYDLEKKICSGKPITGAWPEPTCHGTGVTKPLGKYCAYSPTKFVKYDPSHKWCQASLDTITFCAEVELEVEIAALGLGIDLDVEIDVEADVGISVDLRNTCAGLASIYVDLLVDAVVLFNTNRYGLAAVAADVKLSLTEVLFAKVDIDICILGIGNCVVDCVGYNMGGCHNHVGVGAGVGGSIEAFVGLTVLPGTLLFVGATGNVITVVVETVLCIVGRLLETLLSVYKCNCHA